MTIEQTNKVDSKQLQNDIQQAMTTAQDIKEAVRQITIKALTEGDLNMQSIRQVASAVVKGAGLGAENQDPATKEALNNAISGLDEALAKAAEVSKLALQEAVGRGEDFSSNDLKRALNDIQGIEELLVETLRNVAKSSKSQIAEVLNELADHAEHSGTVVGTQLKDSLTELIKAVGDVGKNQLETGGESIKTTGALLAHLAAGMLEGLAERLHPSNNDDKNSKTSAQDKNN